MYRANILGDKMLPYRTLFEIVNNMKLNHPNTIFAFGTKIQEYEQCIYLYHTHINIRYTCTKQVKLKT